MAPRLWTIPGFQLFARRPRTLGALVALKRAGCEKTIEDTASGGNPPLTRQEHAEARLKALLYARERGNGSDPDYQPHLAVEDFEKAAGDVFGELP
jgi:hypothetical protein